MKHRVHIDYYQFQDKPDSYQTALINNRICKEQVTVTLDEIAQAVSSGKTLIFATSSSNKRIKSDFQQSTLVAIDFDGSINPYKLKKELEPSLIYYSFSHIKPGRANPPSSEKPGWNYRAIWQLKTPITNLEQYTKLVTALIKRFNSDGMCKDALRLFYGSKPNSIFHKNKDIFLTDDEVNILVASMPVTHKREHRLTTKHLNLEDLQQHQRMLLINTLTSFKKYLLDVEKKSNYERLADFLGVLFNIEYLSAELAKDVAIAFIDGDDELSVMFSREKYTRLLETYIDNLEAKYG